MNDDERRRLEDMLGAYSKRVDDRDQKEAERMAVEKAASEQFARVAAEVIEPVLKDFAELLKSKGHEAHVQTQIADESPGTRRRATIEFRFNLKGSTESNWRYSDHSYVPRVAFQFSPSARMIDVHATERLKGGGTSSSSKGSIPIDDVKRETIEKHVMQIVESFLKT